VGESYIMTVSLQNVLQVIASRSSDYELYIQIKKINRECKEKISNFFTTFNFRNGKITNSIIGWNFFINSITPFR
jgi:predicted PolB exonuclease-like 3'-5' exonuclease